MYIPKGDDFLKILTDEEVKDFVAIIFNEYFKTVREEQNLRKVPELFYILLITPDEVKKYGKWNYSDNCVHHYNVEILNLFDPELRLINTKRMIKNKSKEYLSEFKKFNVDVVADDVVFALKIRLFV